MDVTDFSDKLCHLHTAIVKYLDVKKARDFCVRNGHCLHIPSEVIITIECVLGEKETHYEKQIIELATQLVGEHTEQSESQMAKKPKKK